MAFDNLPPPGRLTSMVVLETSLGPLSIGLFGHDCPATVANFVALCEAGFYTGLPVSRVLRRHMAEFRIPSWLGEWTAEGLLSGKEDHGLPLELGNQTDGPTTVSGTTRGAPLMLRHSGLLLALPREDGGGAVGGSFAVTLQVLKPLDYLRRRVTAFGVALPDAEGASWLRRVDGIALTGRSTSGAAATEGTPVSIVRIHRATSLQICHVARPLCDRVHAEFRMATFMASRRPPSPSLHLLHPTAQPHGLSTSNRELVYNYDEGYGALLTEDDDDAEALRQEVAGLKRGRTGAQFDAESDEAAALRKAKLTAQRARVDRTRALMLSLVGDTSSAAAAHDATPGGGAAAEGPPENVLFVCKLNPYTTGEDLATIFSQFGKVDSAEVISHPRTGQSLCYAFVEFASVEACQRAYFKMENVLVDEARIHVDFSQSVSALWRKRKAKAA